MSEDTWNSLEEDEEYLNEIYEELNKMSAGAPKSIYTNSPEQILISALETIAYEKPVDYGGKDSEYYRFSYEYQWNRDGRYPLSENRDVATHALMEYYKRKNK